MAYPLRHPRACKAWDDLSRSQKFQRLKNLRQLKNVPEKHDEPSTTCSDTDLSIDTPTLSVPTPTLSVPTPTLSVPPLSLSFCSEITNVNDIILALQQWSFKYGPTQSSIDGLLRVLKQHKCFHSLPSTARGLLHTPTNVQLYHIEPGHYIHIGIENGIRQGLQLLGTFPLSISLLINIDGLPLSKSTNSQLWTILGSFYKVWPPVVFPIGIYHGHEKPKFANDFLVQFVLEAKYLAKSGFVGYNGAVCKVEICGIVSDAPARAYICGIKSHSGYSACSKCHTIGKYVKGRVVFPDLSALPRKDFDYITAPNNGHHIHPTILSELPIGLVTRVPFDYMHLVCLGVIRKWIRLWIHGPLNVKLHRSHVSQLCNAFSSLTNSCPMEFARKPRSLREVDKWKATEFRGTLLYWGPFGFRNLSKGLYRVFMALHVAMRILCSPELYLSLNDYAKELISYVVTNVSNIYGTEYVSYNCHGLIHLADDARMFGPLDTFSAFCFENYLGTLKKLLKKHDHPLQQLNNRLMEYMSATTVRIQQGMQFKQEYDGGLLIHGCTGPQFKVLSFPTFTLTVNSPDNCCMLKDGSIVLVKNFAFSPEHNSLVMVGQIFKLTTPYYSDPCMSSVVGIKVAEHLSFPSLIVISEVSNKCVIIPLDSSKFLIMQMLHA